MEVGDKLNPDELPRVHFPDLKENQMIIPGTTKLTFNVSLSGTDINRTLVGNLGRNIIRKLIVKLEGIEIISTDDYDIFYSYYNCWKSTTQRRSAVFQGIVEAGGQTKNAIKHRTNAAYKTSKASDEKVASIFDNKMLLNTGQMLLIKHLKQVMKRWHQFLIISLHSIRLLNL